jgi:hypothetical protein
VTLKFDHFLWFGGAPGSPLPNLDGFRIATHNKRNAAGFKTERPNIRLVPKAAFQRVDSIDEIIVRLFGDSAPNDTVQPIGSEQSTSTGRRLRPPPFAAHSNQHPHFGQGSRCGCGLQSTIE